MQEAYSFRSSTLDADPVAMISSMARFMLELTAIDSLAAGDASSSKQLLKGTGWAENILHEIQSISS